MELWSSKESCLCDFTFDFYWQHQGKRLNPDQKVDGYSRREMVDALRRGESVRIHGDVGSRLGCSMGVDLMRFGGSGGPVDVGAVIVDGDAGSRLGISMIRGAIYLAGQAQEPLGNVVEVDSDLTGYRKYVSITDLLAGGPAGLLVPNRLEGGTLMLADGILRETIAARSASACRVSVMGDAGMSAGILMQDGVLDIDGDCGQNTGVLLRGGRIVVRGRTGDFTGAEMRGGTILVEGSAGGFACARMKGGVILARDGKPVPPARISQPSPPEQRLICTALGLSPIQAMMYRRLGI
ncbi:MAG: Molybdenum-containing formylmethanofuran dehydrogenase 1 subunit C [Methanosaeta sp. PtaB.Bin039]|nr:MAG: Molybdenum-containing formylmethanofuran dehydrogenase 1 subunit C [Methanosaeta sp. PtaB.Bin039]OPY44587.1 MAG: Molybdenum-containing formylmethanofuran dehydrogenase 1 subunit C [Methanosaeta sp. PtaU1.Bin028]HOT06425.1 tributyrin esterase [Methanotrichaceae archaeon]HQJ28354.1 tributyrin esterase [Methanotrichaceae archaeon]